MKKMRFMGLALLLVSSSFMQAASSINEEFREEAGRFLSVSSPDRARLVAERLARLGIGTPRRNVDMDDPELKNLYDHVERLLELVDAKKHLNNVSLTTQLEAHIVSILESLPQGQDLAIVSAPDTWSIYRRTITEGSIKNINDYIKTLQPPMVVTPELMWLQQRSAASRVGSYSGEVKSVQAKYLNFRSFADVARAYFAGGSENPNSKNFPDFVKRLLDEYTQSPVEQGSENWEMINYSRLFAYHLLIAAGYDNEYLVTDLLAELQECTVGDETMVQAFNIVLNDDIKRLLYGTKLLEDKTIFDSYLTALAELAQSTATRNPAGQADPVYTELQSVYNSLQIHIIKVRLNKIYADLQAARGEYAAQQAYREEQRALKAAQSAMRAAAVNSFKNKLTTFTDDIEKLIEKRTEELFALISAERASVSAMGRTIAQAIDEGVAQDSLDYYLNQVTLRANSVSEEFRAFIAEDLAKAEEAYESATEDVFLLSFNPVREKGIQDLHAMSIKKIDAMFDLREKTVATLGFDARRPEFTGAAVNVSVIERNLTVINDEMKSQFAPVALANGIDQEALKRRAAQIDVLESARIEATQSMHTRVDAATERVALAQEIDDMVAERQTASVRRDDSILRSENDAAALDAVRVARLAEIEEQKQKDAAKVFAQERVAGGSSGAKAADAKQQGYEDKLVTTILSKPDLKKKIQRTRNVNQLLDDRTFEEALNTLNAERYAEVVRRVIEGKFAVTDITEADESQINKLELFNKLKEILSTAP